MHKNPRADAFQLTECVAQHPLPTHSIDKVNLMHCHRLTSKIYLSKCGILTCSYCLLIIVRLLIIKNV